MAVRVASFVAFQVNGRPGCQPGQALRRPDPGRPLLLEYPAPAPPCLVANLQQSTTAGASKTTLSLPWASPSHRQCSPTSR